MTEITFAAILEDIHDLKRGSSTSTSRDVHGQPYATLAVGGVKEEGQPWPYCTGTARDARKLFMQEFAKFVEQHPDCSVVHWRFFPTLYAIENGFTVRARLSMSVENS